jgi:CheY-like chemotaxis protein
LVNQILLFGKRLEKERAPLAVQQTIDESLKLIRPSIPTTIEIEQDIDADCPNVLGDATQIHQVIVNLCTNAWQAMDEHGGVLSISLKQVELDVAFTQIYPELNPGEHVCISVSDTGTGMDAATLDQIFEPFFTTKPVDKGTGLGLSVAHGIVAHHDGAIVAHSEPGTGTNFQVYLPVISRAMEADEQGIEVPPSIGQGFVLVVDDEIEIADMVEEMLVLEGYRVSSYGTGADALEALRSDPGKVDLLIADLTMPRLTGLELLQEARKLKPELPTILMTGYGGKSLEGLPAHQIVLFKPFTKHTLNIAIQEALAGVGKNLK